MKKRSSFKLPYSSRSLMKTATGVLVGLIMMGLFWVADASKEIRQPGMGGSPEFFANELQDDLRRTYVEAIDRAQTSIIFIIYALTDDGIINALNKKAAEGVDIRIICEAKASPYIDRKLKGSITLMRRFAEGLMHLKILSIDDHEVWIGSANMSSESLRMHGNLVAAVVNPDLAAMVREKADGMTEYGRAKSLSHRAFSLDGQKMEMWFLPDDAGAAAKIKELIRSATKTLRVAMFTFTREDLAKQLVAAAKRGVDVQVAMDRSSSQGASKKIAELLQREGVPVYFNKGAALLHHKFLYIDGTTLVNGSANWTRAAFTQNDDCFMILNNLTPTQSAYMDSLWGVIKK